MEVYFVVYYDDDSGKLFIDDETAGARFNEGLIWDQTCEEWLDQGDYPALDERAAMVVKALVDLYNEVLKPLEPSP